MREIELIHQEIETIFTKSVDHIHADIVHRHVDEQAERIKYLESALEEANTESASRLKQIMEMRSQIKELEVEVSLARENHCGCLYEG